LDIRIIKCDLSFILVAKVTVPDVYPILPSQAGEKQPDNLSKWLLEGLLSYMVSEVGHENTECVDENQLIERAH